MSEWCTKQIKDLGRVVTGKTPPTNNPEYFDGDKLFVSPKDLGWDQFYVKETETHISTKALEKFRNQVIPKNAVMFTSLSFAFGKIGIASEPSLTNQQINSVIVNEQNCFRFVYYLLRVYRPIIFSYNSGIDTPIVPKSVFESIKVKTPDKVLQRKIAAILSAYDDLIENNKRRIVLLEKMAEEIYREWFVRMRFPRHEKVKFEKGVPEGWAKVSLSNLGKYLNGYAFKQSDWYAEGTPIIKIKEMTSGVSPDTPRNTGESIDKKYHFSDEDIIFSWSATLLVKIWDQGPGLLNQHLFKVTPSKNIPKSFLYFSIKFSLEMFESLTTGATMKHIKRKELDFVKVNLPPREILDQFDSIVFGMLKNKLNLSKSNRLLIEVRDKLSGRLISGKLSVEGLDIQFPPSMIELTSFDEHAKPKRALLDVLKDIKINAPKDFSENLDAYLNGEKYI